MEKILLLTENFPPLEGGSCRWFWELYKRLPNDQVVVVCNQTRESDAFDKTHSINTIRIPLSSPEWGVKSIKGLKFYYHCIMSLRRIIKQHKITEIHCGRIIHEGVTAWLLNVFTGIKFICYVHGEDVETAATSREQLLLVKQVCKNSHRIICNSENSIQLLEKHGLANRKKCRKLHPGVDLTFFHPAPDDIAFKQKMGWQNKLVILTVGRLQQRKGQDYFIQALPALIKHYPDILYVSIGNGDQLTFIERLIEENKLQQHTQIHTSLTDADLLACYQQCDLFILPNRTINNDIEGFGMVLVEAQACGKGVVAGDSGGTWETLLPNKTGKIIDCNSPELIASQLLPIIHNKDYENWSQDAREHVEAHFCWEKHVEKAVIIFAE